MNDYDINNLAEEALNIIKESHDYFFDDDYMATDEILIDMFMLGFKDGITQAYKKIYGEKIQ